MHFKAPVSGELSVDILRVSLVKNFNWTLDYIDTLSVEEIRRLLGILEGMDRHEKQESKMRGK